MLQYLENLSACRFRTIIIAIFVPIWTLTGILAWCVYNSKSFSIGPSGITFLDDVVEKQIGFNEKLQELDAIVRDLREVQSKLLNDIDNCLKSNSNCPTFSQPVNAIKRSSLMELRDQISNIQFIPESYFIQTQKELEKLKDTLKH